MNATESGQKREERALFKAFLQHQPDFAGESVSQWDLADCGGDPPDVISTTISGKRVGVEICQWAPQAEMKAGKLRQKIDQRLRDVIGTQDLLRPCLSYTRRKLADGNCGVARQRASCGCPLYAALLG